MNKTELLNAVAEKTGFSKARSDMVVSVFIEQVTNALARGHDVALIGFGTFSVSKRSGRRGRNPASGETIFIDARNQAVFKAGKKLRESINEC